MESAKESTEGEFPTFQDVWLNTCTYHLLLYLWFLIPSSPALGGYFGVYKPSRLGRIIPQLKISTLETMYSMCMHPDEVVQSFLREMLYFRLNTKQYIKYKKESKYEHYSTSISQVFQLTAALFLKSAILYFVSVDRSKGLCTLNS